MKAVFEGDKIKMERHTAGDSRVSNSVPTREEFDKANNSHRKDVLRNIFPVRTIHTGKMLRSWQSGFATCWKRLF